MNDVLVVKDLQVHFLLENMVVKAVDGVNFHVNKNETLALIGESGSGKSTLSRILLLLIKPTSGKVFFDRLDLTGMKGKELRKIRQKMQLIPQHPEDALDPRWRLYNSIAEPLRIHKLVENKEEEQNKVFELTELVGLKDEHLSRYPHEMSGGELQRAVIARALSLNPKLIVCDEPTSMLDVSVQASIINLLLDLQHKFGLAYLFITHDLELANAVSSRIAVMYCGQIVEEGIKILDDPLHPYTKMLVKSLETAISNINFDAIKFKAKKLDKQVGLNQKGCKFYHLCPNRTNKCLNPPKIVKIDDRSLRCWVY